MKNLLIVCILLFPICIFARSGPPSGGAKRGGQGFLFEDFNSFSNPGQKALFRGFAIQADFGTVLNTGTKSVTPSIVWGKGSFGLGGFVSRSGSDLANSSATTDTVGGALGFGLASNRMTAGVGYVRSVDIAQNMDGVLTASINFNGLGGKGIHFGGAFGTTVNRASRDIRSGVVGIGWGFGRIALEGNYSVSDFKDPSNLYEASGYFAWEGETLFTGFGMGYDKANNATFGAGRIGLRIKKWDLSAYGNKSFATGSNTALGGALRVKF